MYSAIKDTVVVGDRLGSDANCKHGDYYTCHDRYQPQSLQNHLWMDCMTIGWPPKMSVISIIHTIFVLHNNET